VSDDGPSLDALVDAARGDGTPTDGDRARVRRKLAARLGAAAFVTTASAGAASGAKIAGLVSAGVGRYVTAVLLVAAAGGGYVAVRARAPSPRVAVSAHRRAPVVTPREASLAPPAPVRMPPVVAPVVVVAPAAPPTRQRAVVRAHEADTPPGASIAAEVDALRDARRAMTEGDPERALAILDAHDRAGSVGALRVERFAARLIAQCRLGRARDLDLRSFFFHHGSSPLAQGVADACRR